MHSILLWWPWLISISCIGIVKNKTTDLCSQRVMSRVLVSRLCENEINEALLQNSLSCSCLTQIYLPRIDILFVSNFSYCHINKVDCLCWFILAINWQEQHVAILVTAITLVVKFMSMFKTPYNFFAKNVLSHHKWSIFLSPGKVNLKGRNFKDIFIIYFQLYCLGTICPEVTDT